MDEINYRPLISIGLPVYNGENFVSAAIDSILAQTFTNFELIISDNASTDSTEAICRRYASQDARIHYFRSLNNRGPAWNYNRVFALAQGKYFKWAAHDDLLAPSFLAETLGRFTQNPAAVLCFSGVEVIDEKDDHVIFYNVRLASDSSHPVRRLQEMMSLKHRCYDIFGLIKTEVLQQTPLIGAYAGSDRVLLSRLSLHGPFETVLAPLFKARQHAKQSIAMLRSPRHQHLRMHDYAVWFDPSNQGKILLPNWRIFYEYFLAISSAPLATADRLKGYGVLFGWLFAYSNWAKLIRDVVIASILLVLRLKSKVQSAFRLQRRAPVKTQDYLAQKYGFKPEQVSPVAADTRTQALDPLAATETAELTQTSAGGDFTES